MLANPDKPQSAPAVGRSAQQDMPGKPLTSKFLRKGNAVREIQDWASDGTAPGFSRHSGQLSDNVTEERMLKSKIMDLSKERYKYMTQSVYDMKQFLDKQKRKSRVLQDLLKNIDVDSSSRRKSWPVQLGNGEDSGVNHARHAFLDRFDPTKARDRPKEIVELERQQEEERNKRAASQLSMPRLRTPVFQTEPRLTKKASSQSLPCVHGKQQAGNASIQETISEEEEAFNNNKPKVLVKSVSDLHDKRAYLKKVRSRSPVRDPRYTELVTDVLSAPYSMESPVEVSAVVSKMPALHVPPRQPKEAKPKLANKIQEYMRERGIVF